MSQRLTMLVLWFRLDVDMFKFARLSDRCRKIIMLQRASWQGYYGNDAATAAAFRAGVGWFDTGDLGWVAPRDIAGSRMAGTVVLSGRSKDTIVLSRCGRVMHPSAKHLSENVVWNLHAVLSCYCGNVSPHCAVLLPFARFRR